MGHVVRYFEGDDSGAMMCVLRRKIIRTVVLHTNMLAVLLADYWFSFSIPLSVISL